MDKSIESFKQEGKSEYLKNIEFITREESNFSTVINKSNGNKENFLQLYMDKVLTFNQIYSPNLLDIPYKFTKTGKWSLLKRCLRKIKDTNLVWSYPSIRKNIRKLLTATVHKEKKNDDVRKGCKPCATETSEMVFHYVRLIKKCVLFKEAYTTNLNHESNNTSPLKPEGHYKWHHKTCKHCKSRYTSDWEEYKKVNHFNTCYISHILAWLTYGWLPAFQYLPVYKSTKTSKDFQSKGRFDLKAALYVKLENDKFVQMGAVKEVSKEEVEYISPTLIVIKEHELLETIQFLQQKGIDVEDKYDVNDVPIDLLNDELKELKEKGENIKLIKVRFCINYSTFINDSMYDWKFTYTSITDSIKDLCVTDWACKIDLTSMFWQIGLHPAAQKYFAYTYDDKYYIPNRTPFGAKPIPALANTLSSEVNRILINLGIRSSFMTDDFLILGKSEAECLQARGIALEVFSEMGWDVNPSKVTDPSTSITFLGYFLDIPTLSLSIPRDRLIRYSDLISHSATLEWTTAKDLQKVLGVCNWITEVFPRGKPYLSFLYELLSGFQGDKKLKLLPQHIQDLSWWSVAIQELLKDSEGSLYAFTLLLSPNFVTTMLTNTIRVYSDASGEKDDKGKFTQGYGITFNGKVYQGKWIDPEFTSTAYLELYPLLILLKLYAKEWKGKTIIFTSDNISNTYAILKYSTTCNSTSQILREMIEICCENNINMLADWIPRDYNVYCDFLSKKELKWKTNKVKT